MKAGRFFLGFFLWGFSLGFFFGFFSLGFLVVGFLFLVLFFLSYDGFCFFVVLGGFNALTAVFHQVRLVFDEVFLRWFPGGGVSGFLVIFDGFLVVF